MNTSTSSPTAAPLSLSSSEAARQKHTRLRRRILYRRHRPDIEERIRKSIGNVRKEAWGEIDLSSNPFAKTYDDLSTLYDALPEVEPPDGAEDAAAALAASGYWTLMRRIQRDTLGLRDMLLRVEIEGNELIFEPAYPDLVEVEVGTNPRKPEIVREWVVDPDDPSAWVRLIFDVTGTGSYTVEDSSGQDVSARVLKSEGGLVGEAYPYRVGEAPVLPYVAYHAEDTGFFWDPYDGQEVVEGTLQLGVLYTYYSHVVRGAAWAQRWAMGAEPAGQMSKSGGGRRAEVVSDPATLLLLQPVEGYDGQATVGQWSSPIDPDKVLASIMAYERRLVEMALGSTDVTRSTSDIRSGYSLAVSREAKREAQRRSEPLFRKSDTAMCELVAGLMGLPVEGWRIRYHGIPRDAAEIKAEWETLSELIAAGLLDPVSAYIRLNPGATRPEAEAALAKIAENRRRFGL